MGLLRTRFDQEGIQFVLIGKGDADLAQVLADLPGVLLLAARNILCQLLQLVLFRIKAIAEHIGRLTSPRGTRSTAQGSTCRHCKWYAVAGQWRQQEPARDEESLLPKSSPYIRYKYISNRYINLCLVGL